MIKNLKKIISVALVIVLMTMGTTTAFAEDTSQMAPYNTQVIADDTTTRIAESYSNGCKYVSTYDKITRVAIVQQYDIETETLISEVIARADGISTCQNTFSNFEYDKTYGSPNRWELRRPDGSFTGTIYFKTNETSSNRQYLNSFKAAVDQINSIEIRLMGSIGMEAFTGALSVFLVYITGGVGAPLAAYLASIGFAGTAINQAADLDYQCNIALDNYWEAFYHSNVYY